VSTGERPPRAAAAPSAVTRMLVADDEAGLRLDAFLARKRLAASAQAARRLLADGLVRVDGRPAKKGARLAVGQAVDVQAVSGDAVAPDGSVPLVVLFEDEHLVALDKPAGVPAHPLRPGERGTLASALVLRHPECAAASPDAREAGLGHRLDVGTSGVLVAARSREVWTRLRQILGGGDSEKTYLAEVAGAPASDAVVVDEPIGRSGRRGSKVRLGSGRGLLSARTEIHVLERRPQTTLVEARLRRGRAHQVRAHLAHVGCPVVGDATYGDPANTAASDGLHLHAWRLSLPHPVTGAPLLIEAPPPAWARPRR